MGNLKHTAVLVLLIDLSQSMHVVHKIGKVIECKTYSINPAFTYT